MITRDADVFLLANWLPSVHEALGSIPNAAETRCGRWYKWCNPSTLDVEERGLEFNISPWYKVNLRPAWATGGLSAPERKQRLSTTVFVLSDTVDNVVCTAPFWANVGTSVTQWHRETWDSAEQHNCFEAERKWLPEAKVLCFALRQ